MGDKKAVNRRASVRNGSVGANNMKSLLNAVYSYRIVFAGLLVATVLSGCATRDTGNYSFGTRWAGGCTSGHAISGLADLQLPSLIAAIGFFVGGLLMTHFLFPLIF